VPVNHRRSRRHRDVKASRHDIVANFFSLCCSMRKRRMHARSQSNLRKIWKLTLKFAPIQFNFDFNECFKLRCGLQETHFKSAKSSHPEKKKKKKKKRKRKKKMTSSKLLQMIPGPTYVPERVRAAYLSDVASSDVDVSAFFAEYSAVQAQLRRVVRTEQRHCSADDGRRHAGALVGAQVGGARRRSRFLRRKRPLRFRNCRHGAFSWLRGAGRRV
jgi:hypothetical protein